MSFETLQPTLVAGVELDCPHCGACNQNLELEFKCGDTADHWEQPGCGNVIKLEIKFLT